MRICLIIFFTTSIAFAKNCIPNWEAVPFPHYGNYHRVHPSGDYIIYSEGGIKDSAAEVFILDISKKDKSGKRIAKRIPTPMGFEAAPVEPHWKFISTAPNSRSPVASSEFSFYKFEELILRDESNFQELKPEMVDPRSATIYQSIVEVETTETTAKYKMTNYMDTNMLNYEVTTLPTGKKTIKQTASGKFCGNLTEASEEKYRKLRDERVRLTSVDPGQPPPSVPKEQLEKLKSDMDHYSKVGMLATPILSKDGKYLATKYGHPHTIKVFKLAENGDCEIVRDTGYDGSKVSFSYPQPGKLPSIVFTNGDPYTGLAQVIHYDLESDKVHILSRDEDGHSLIPGFTRDGRVIYGNYAGIVIADAKRITSGQKDCTLDPTNPLPPGEQKRSKRGQR